MSRSLQRGEDLQFDQVGGMPWKAVHVGLKWPVFLLHSVGVGWSISIGVPELALEDLDPQG